MGTRRGIRVAVLWFMLAMVGVFRPGADAFDRWLVKGCWGVPSLWNAVAETAIREGAVDPRIDGREAPWKRACILDAVPPRLAVVVVSDMRRARVTVLDEEYRVRGVFERATQDPDLITDETRGYMPLSHLWPVHDWYRDGRLETLVALLPTYSDPLAQNVFAYLALGSERNELLLACRVRGKRSPPEAILDQTDVDGDGYPDLVVYPDASRRVALMDESRPWAVFRWDAPSQAFEPRLRPGAEQILSYWCSSPRERVFIGQRETFEDRVMQLVDRGESAVRAENGP